VGLSESNDVSEPNKPDPEQAKIDAHLEQRRLNTETRPSGGAAAGATAPATTLIKSVWQNVGKGLHSELVPPAGPPAAVSQDAWKERSRAN
jgi:hypothetical protein